MSYETYPPPLSSSPPPLDTLPSPTDEEDEEEFGHRAGVGSPVFDITGLSEKLPPTPIGSPLKSVRSASPSHAPNTSISSGQHDGALPPDSSCTASSDVLSDDEFGDFAVGTCNDISENRTDDNNQLPVEICSEDSEKLSCREAQPNNSNFGEFLNFQSSFNSFPAADIQTSSEPDEKHPSSNESNVSDIVLPIEDSAPEPCDYSVINPTKGKLFADATSENMSSPMCSVNNSESICIEREKSTASFPELVKDEHGHLVPKKPFIIDKEEDVFHYFQSPTAIPFSSTENPEPLKVEPDQKSLPDDKLSENESDICFEVDNSKLLSNNEFPPLQSSISNSNQSISHDAPIVNDIDVDFGVDDNNSSSVNCHPIHVTDADCQLSSAQSIDVPQDDFEAFADFQSFPSTDEPFKAVFECSPGTGVVVPADGALVDEVVMSCSLPTIEGMADHSPDDDFGYRNIDIEDDSHDHKEQDFQAIEAKNDHVIHEAGPEIITEGDDDDDDEFDEFDDFVVSTEVADDPEEFDEFASAKIADAFGEFASESASKMLEKEANDIPEKDDDDGFGEFTDFSVADASTGISSIDAHVSSALSLSRSVSIDSRPDLDSINDPFLSKLDGLVRKWIILPPETSVPPSPPDVLRDLVKGDAFVWRKLESVEWESVVWQSTVAHGLLLNALNMDARNILYTQKWSSSVPLFAQSLSFSPLTPAKPTSGSGLSSHTQNSASSDTCQPPAQLPSSGGGDLATESVSETASSHRDNTRVLSAATDIDVSSLDSLHPSLNKVPSSSSNLDWLSYEGSSDQSNSQSSGESSARSTGAAEPSMPAAVQRLLATSATTASHMTSLDQLTDRERKFLKSLPDFSFMTAKVLMFPIAGEKD